MNTLANATNVGKKVLLGMSPAMIKKLDEMAQEKRKESLLPVTRSTVIRDAIIEYAANFDRKRELATR